VGKHQFISLFGGKGRVLKIEMEMIFLLFFHENAYIGLDNPRRLCHSPGNLGTGKNWESARGNQNTKVQNEAPVFPEFFFKS
jgi:hypothetical protein